MRFCGKVSEQTLPSQCLLNVTRASEKLNSCLYTVTRLTAVGTRCADHVTPLYPQKLALTSPTGGGRSVGIVRVRTKATELSLYCYTKNEL